MRPEPAFHPADYTVRNAKGLTVCSPLAFCIRLFILGSVGHVRPWSLMPPTTKILLVDDDATVLDLVRETLEGCGYTIDTVTNSQEALARVHVGGYSMIILDLLLPDMNGFILAQEIKRIDPGLSDRILFISGILFGQSTVDHLGSVGAGFLSKPFQLESLIEAVDKIAKKRVA